MSQGGTMQNIILREANGIEIRQRADNYFDATAMCRAYGKAFADYRRLQRTEEWLNALSANMGIPTLELVQARVGGNHSGTWVHELVAIDLAMWCSPPFAVIVISWIRDLLQGKQVNVADARDLDPFVIGQLMEKVDVNTRQNEAILKALSALQQQMPVDIEQAVKAHVHIPRADFTPATRRLIFREWIRQNPSGLDPTGWVRIITNDAELIDGVGELHHMNGPHRIGFRDGLPVTKEFHRKLTADRERRGDEWRRAGNAHRYFLDRHDASQVTLMDMLGRKSA